jgi:hypothetical protein
MLTLRRGRVTAVLGRAEGLARIEVDGLPCVAYPRLTGPVALGDEVIVNVQARELELGSGGFDVLYVNVTRGLELPSEHGAHVMKLPYSPGQAAAVHAEEGRELPETLDGLPVVCCSLHSQVAPVCAGIGEGVRVSYIQLPGGALPVSLSDTLRVLRTHGLVAATVAVGACVDGDVQCVSVASALLWCAAEGFEVAVCGIGPGVVGTGTSFGHGGLAAVSAASAASALGGQPILAVRASQGDPRDRHRGVSHHVHDIVRLCGNGLVAAWPAGQDADAPEWLPGVEQVEVSGWEVACEGLPLAHMGRTSAQDPLFFASAFAAGRLARRRLENDV